MIVDVHCHLDHGKFTKDLDKVIERAKEAGVGIVVTNGLNGKTNAKCLELASKYSGVECALGMYPCEDYSEKDFSFILENVDKCIAIGEIGLDYYWDTSDIPLQKEVFVRMINIGVDNNKPVIVHSRKAEKDVIEILEKEKVKKVVMHCFCGGVELAKRCEKNGWHFSIPCRIDAGFRELIKAVDVSRLFVESDGPYLGEKKGVRNEPANVAKTIAKIAEIKGMDEEEVEKVLFMNYQGLFL